MRSKLLLGSAVFAGVVLTGACRELPARVTAPPVVDGLRTRPANTTCLAPANALGRVRLEPTSQAFENPVAMIDRPDF